MSWIGTCHPEPEREESKRLRADADRSIVHRTRARPPPISRTLPSIEPGVKPPRVTFHSAVSLPTSALCRYEWQALTS